MKRRTIEEKKELIARAEALHATGVTWPVVAKQLGMTSAGEVHRFRKQVERNKNNVTPISEIRQVNNGTEKMLRAENTRLRTLVVNLSLDVQTLKEYYER